jgi:AraC family transcriptional regulator
MSSPRLASGEFYGVATKRTAAGGLLLVRTEYAPRAGVAAHWHERPYFCFLERGSFDEISSGRRRRHTAGELIFHPAGETHADSFSDQGGVCVNLEVPPDLMADRASPELSAVDGVRRISNGAARRLASQIARELRRAAASALVLEGLGLALLGEACRTVGRRETGRRPDWLRRAVDLIHDRYREPLALRAIAFEAGVHPVHLARTFREELGLTVGEYIRTRRLEFACHQLTNHDLTIAEIAHDAGFADHAHFCRVFREHVGTSPGRFRRAVSSGHSMRSR